MDSYEQAGNELALVLGSQKHKEALLGISGHHVHPSPSNKLPCVREGPSSFFVPIPAASPTGGDSMK